MKKLTALAVLIVVTLVGCAPSPQAAVQTLVAVLPAEVAPVGPLGGQIAALPTPDPNAVTPTPPPSQLSFPTDAPTAIGPLATLTAISGLLPTMDLDATPYAIPYRGVPVFIEFQARW